MTTDQSGHRHQEGTVVGMSIEVEIEAPIGITVVDEVGRVHRMAGVIGIAVEVLEAAIWTTKQTFQCREEIQGTCLRFK